jgi:hypothetical protein
MASVLTYTVGDYRRIDSRPTDQYATIGVAEAIQWARNHNAIMARRSRQVLVTQAFHRGSSASATEPLLLACGGTSSTNLGLPFFRTRIIPSQTFNGEIKCEIHAEVGGAGPRFVPRIVGRYLGQELPSASGYMIEPTSSSRVFLDCKLTRPGWLYAEYFEIFAVSPMTGADLKGADANVVDAGVDWVDVDDTTGAAAGVFIYFTSDDTIEPRMINRVDGLRIFADRPWNKMPDADTPDAANWRSANTIGLYSVCLYQERITSFTAGLGALP